MKLTIAIFAAVSLPFFSATNINFDAMKLNITTLGSTVLQDANLDPSVGLNPTPVAPAVRSFMSGLVNTAAKLMLPTRYW